jgi:CARDB protein
MRVTKRKAQVSLLLALVLLLSTFGSVFAQTSANDTNFTTSVTYGNGGTGEATVIFKFYREGQASTAAEETVSLKQNATASLYLGNVSGLSGAFQGSATISADQPVQAVVVQVPQNNPFVVNRPLSNGFRSGGSQSVIATVLKSTFGQTTSFSCQNADTTAVDIEVKFINSTDASTTATEKATNIPVGAAKFFAASDIAALPAGWNGSAIAMGYETGTTTAADIVCSVSELGTSGGTNAFKAKAFEGVAQAGNSFYVSSALCDVFGGQSTAYAVTNASTTAAANVTVAYSGGATDTATIQPGQKKTFLACDKNTSGYSGAATITSTGAEVVAIAKKFQSGTVFETAFSGEASGADTLSLPYVRWAPDADFSDGSGKYQRAYIAIQNVGSGAASNVTVKYYDVEGKLVGTHTISSIAAGAKANSNPTNMTKSAGISQTAVDWFGTPNGNAASSGVSGKYGGGAVIEASGATLVAIASITSSPSSGKVQEDYNAIQ